MAEEQPWKPKANPWLIAVAVMLATFIEVLDTSIANVALPSMAGNLGATNSEATWVLTSYLVSNAIILPATDWLGRRFGRKRFLMSCIVLFTLASAACGAAQTLGFLILARVIQGAGGGALQPIAQAVLLESFPVEKRNQAMALFGLGVVVAPVLGPALGGWITDSYSWRWIFYINIPFGLAAVLMGQWLIEDPPYIVNAVRNSIDFVGFGLMAVWLASLQIVFDKGQEADWFHSPMIATLSAISVLSLLAFLYTELRVKNPIVNLRVLRNSNFATGTFLIGIIGAVLYGATALLPLFLQTLMGYPALQSGLAVAPRGMGAIVSMMMVGIIANRADPRLLISSGLAGLGIANLAFSHLDLQIAQSDVIFPNVLTGLCLGFIFVPLTTQSTATLSSEAMGNATGIYNLMRNIGGSIGISGLIALLDNNSQIHQALMVPHMTASSAQFQSQLGSMSSLLGSQVGQVHGTLMAYGIMQGVLVQQAALVSYMDVFRTMALICFAAIPFVFIMRPARTKGPVMVH